MAEGLTAKQERFCVEYVSNGSKSYSDAYRAVFNCSKMKPGTVNNKASKLAAENEIQARIKQLQDEAAERAMVTLVGHLEDLKRLRDEAREARQFNAAINAEIARGKAAGLYVERSEVSGPEGQPVSIVVAFDGGRREPV